MRLSKDLIGKSIVTINDGRVIGKAKDIYLTADMSRLAGIHLGKEGVIQRRAILIPADSVEVFGIDVILISSADALTDSRQLTETAEWLLISDITGRAIDTPGGTKVATFDDVKLDEDGSVLAIALDKVYVDGPIKQNRVVYRSSILDFGHQDGTMTIDITKAESLEAPQKEPTDSTLSDLSDDTIDKTNV